MLPRGAPRSRWPRATVAAAASAVGLLAALPYLLAGPGRSFIAIDDDVYVTANPRVLGGVSAAAVRWAATSFHAGNWHPLTWLSHLADVSLFGLDARGHHATSVLLHALAAAALCVALARLTGSLVRASLAAALFGVHPLHVESVAWVAERKDVLAGLCFALVLLAYERYVRRPGPSRYGALAALFALGLTAKPMLVTVPFLLLLIDAWPLGRLGRGLARPVAEKLPLLALAAASATLTVLAQRAWGTVTPLRTFPPLTRLANAADAAAAYLAATAWPAGLAVYYPHPLQSLPPARVAAAALALAALTAAAWAARRSRPALLTGWLWYLGMLVPVVGLIQVGSQARADRYTYLPLVGIFLALAWGLAPPAPAPAGRRRSGALAAGAVAALACFGAASLFQAGLWRDSETLFRHTLAVTRNNWLIHNNLGGALVAAGRLDEAAAQFAASLRIRPSAETHNNLGTVLLRKGRTAEALAEYRLAARARPDYAPPRYNLGQVAALLGRADEAIGHYREALRLKPDFVDAALALGRALQSQGRPAEAAEAYRAALAARPGSAEARAGLAAVTRP